MGDPRLILRSSYREFKGKNTAPILLEDDSSRARKSTKTGSGRSSSSGLEPYNGEWSAAQVAHLLKRISFGIQESEIEQLIPMGVDQAVDLVTNSNPNQSLPINNYTAYETDPYVEAGESWVHKPYGEGIEFLRVFSLKNWILESYMKSSLSIHEKMVLFWHNLIPTQFFLIEVANLSYAYYKILDDNALGNFREIIKRVTVDSSMLLYLNGAYNIKEAPDENYARELQELFTVGKGPNSKYTEQDVYEAARILTGWTIDVDAIIDEGRSVSYFEPEYHDQGDKTFSAFYGNRTISGKSGESGQDETDELIDMILDTNEAALYICRRLYNFFVYHEIDDDTEANVIAPLAEIFRTNNYEIQPVIRTLLKSEHFYDTANIGAYVKNPMDHTLGMLRTAEVPIPEDLEEQFDYVYQKYYLMNEAGMGIGDPPSVSGWQAYYQQPIFDKIWINADTLINRAQIQDYFIYGLMDVAKFVATLPNPEDPNRLIIDSNFLLQGITLDETVISDLKTVLLAGQQTDDYWTTAWNLYQNDPENEEYRSTVENRLKQLFRQFLQLSEFQLM
ncbi:MAG: DUF1800 domain-containing protein [Ekhidna sp.]|nr:DUF1800 domain-containing protein [Ekhidna sp.]